MYINDQKVSIRRYSSGELKFIKSDLDKCIMDNKVKIIYENELSFFELVLILKYYKNNNVMVDLILSYLPYQRMDHEGIDELDTVNYVFDILNDLNLNSIAVCEPHCDVSGLNNCRVISLVKNIKEKVFKEINFDEESDFAVLTDKGGVERYGDISKNIAYFKKVRDKETGLIVSHELVENIDKSKKFVIIDDIISTGDTIVNIINKLVSLDVKEIYIISGHIENNKYNERINSFSCVKGVYSSNSLLKRENEKIKLYDVYDIVKELC